MTTTDRLAYAIRRELSGHPALVNLLAAHVGPDAAIPAARELAIEFARTLAAAMQKAGWRPSCPERDCGRPPELVCEHRSTFEETP